MPTPDFLHILANVSVPTNEQLVPWIISALFAIITGFGGWLLKALIPAIKELKEQVRILEQRLIETDEEHQRGHAAMVQAMLVLTFKVNNPDANVSNEASTIRYPNDDKDRHK